MLETILAAIASYVGTNLDDILIDTFYFVQAQSKHQVRAIVLGKYLGVGALVLMSLLGAGGLQLIPQKYIGLLGLVPMALGIKEWMEGRRASRTDGEDAAEISERAELSKRAKTSRQIEVSELSKQAESSDSDGTDGNARPNTSSLSLALQMMAVTMVNGADNIGVYIPLFAAYTLSQITVVVVVFALMLAFYCLLAKKLADLPALRTFLLDHKQIIVPLVYIALGLYILTGSGLFA